MFGTIKISPPGAAVVPAGANVGANRTTAKMVSRTNSTSAMSCVVRNGCSDCVGARAFSAGTFMNNCTIKTNTLR
jgi:hypothetical protein